MSQPASPEPLCLVVYGPPEASGLVVVELRNELCVFRLVRVGGKFHCDWLSGPRWFLAIQALDGFFRLRPLVKPDKSHAPGHTWGREGSW